jgi:tetratricopeptide (TPR) repeat protein
MRTLNVRFLFILLGLGAVVVIGVALTHYFQTARIERALLAQASAAEAAGKPELADLYLSRYLEFQPGDVEQRARLGQLLAGEQMATSPRARQRAVTALEQALGRDPDRRDSRRLLVRLALDLGNLELAREHLKILCESSDAEAEELRGRLHEAQSQYAEAADWYRKAIGHDATRVNAYARLADLLRRYPAPGQADAQAEEADRVIDDLVANNGGDPKAHVARWRYRLAFQRLNKDEEAHKRAADDVARARELAPDDAEVIVAVAQLAQLDERFGEARAVLKGGLERHPQDTGLYRALAALEMQAGERKAAADCLRVALKKLPPAAQGETLWTLTHLLIDGTPEDRTEAGNLIAQMRRSAGPSAAADYLQARLLMVERKPAEAARLLERARPTLGDTPEVGEEIDLSLGYCYEQLGEVARQKEAYERLAKRSVKSMPVLLGLAAAESSLGNLEAAVARYREAAALPGAPPEVGHAVVRLLIARHRERGAADWGAVEAALREVEKAQPGSPEAVLLRAEALAAQEKWDEARRALEAACAADAEYKQPRLRLALATVLARRGDAEPARALLDEARQRGGDNAAWRVASVNFWAGRPREEAAPALARLAEGMDGWSAADQGRVVGALAAARARSGDIKEVKDLCVRLTRLPGRENDAGLFLLLCELGARTDDEAVLREALADLLRVEGGQGPGWCCGEAMRLTLLARQGRREGLPEAARLLDVAAAKRPGWPALALAKAEVAELRDRPEEAISHYRAAMALGERGARVSRRLVELLYRQQRYREAEEELRSLPREGPGADRLDLLAADLSLRNHDADRAVKTALQSIPATAPRDYRDVLWLGQLLAASPGHAAEAEKQLRRALQMDDTAPETWVALIQFLADRGQVKEADDLLRQAAGKLPAAKRPLALAPCYETLGRLDLAREQYAAALRADGNDVGVLRAAAGFYLRSLQPHDAEPFLRRIAERKVRAGESDVAWARLGLAVELASRGDDRSYVEALGLVGLAREGGRLVEVPQAGEDTIERRRARAHVLSTRVSRALHGKAIELLEELDAQQKGLYPSDRFLLSRLYEMTGDLRKAEAQLRRVVETSGRHPAFLFALAENLIRQDKPTEAGPVVERLGALEKERQVAAGTFGTAELRARLLEATGYGERAVTLLAAHAARDGAAPDDVLLPINSLIRQQRYDRALELTERAWQSKCPPALLAEVHVGLLRSARLTAGEPLTRAERLLRAALSASPRNTGVLFALAGLEDLRGRFAEAEAYYRQVLAVDGDNARALNNLAWLLALRGRKGDEALPLIQRAVELYGPRPDLLDTRALVYLALERPDKARADLKAALADTPTATRYLHLARVCQAADDADGAAAALKEAKALGLRRAQLHPVEVTTCTKLLEGID